MAVLISQDVFAARRTAELEAEAAVRAAAAGKEKFAESQAAMSAEISDSIILIGDGVHPKVEALLSTPAREFVTVDEEGFRLTVRHYLYERLAKNGTPLSDIDVPWKACVDYLESLLTDIALMSERGESIVKDPYVSSWKERGRYDMAGDAALYGYLFYYRRKGNRLTRRDYANMGVRAYYDWYGQGVAHNEFNVGKHVADRLPRLLPLVADCPNDVFSKRFHVV